MRHILFGAICLVAGLVLGASFSGRRSTPPAPVVRAVSSADDARLASIEDRLQALNDRLRQPATSAPSAPARSVPAANNSDQATAPSVPARRVPTPAEAAEHVRQLQQDVRRDHAAESVDPRWAASARPAFDTHLSALSNASGYEVLGTPDCRSTTCLAQIRWPHCSQVHEGTRAVEGIGPDEHSPLYGCSTLLLQANPEPGHEQEACDGLIRVDCEHARTNGSGIAAPPPRS